MSSEARTTEKKAPQEFEQVAREYCAEILETVRDAFAPSRSIEALVLLAFSHGAAWALDIPKEEMSRRVGINRPPH